MYLIANTKYDVVFSRLLKNEKAAKLLLSTIIGKEIISLDNTPIDERPLDKRKFLTVFRRDFNIKTTDPDGSEKQLSIRLRKAKYASDITWFHNQLYQFPSHKKGTTPSILNIYFTIYPLDGTDAPVIDVKETAIDVITGMEIKPQNEFFQNLTHNSIIIQMNNLKGCHLTDLGDLWQIFDLSNKAENGYCLRIDGEKLEDRYYPILQQLWYAMADEIVRETMYAEDEIIAELQWHERKNLKRERAIKEYERKMKEFDIYLLKERNMIS